MTVHFSVAFMSRMFMGLVTAPAVASVLYLSIRHLPPRLFGLAAGMTEMMGMMGGMSEAGLGLGIERLGWRVMMVFCALMGIGLSALMYGLIPKSGGDNESHGHHYYANYSLSQRLFAVIQQPQAWLTGAIAGCVFTLVTAFAGLWCVPYLKKLYSISNGQAGWGSAIVFFGVAIGAPFLGALGEKAQQKKLFLAAVLAAEMMVLVTIFYWPPLHFALMLACLFTAGFLAGMYIIPFSLINAYAPHYAQATAIGFMNMMLIIGGPILQPVIGHILELDPHSSYQAFQVALTPILVCFSLALLMVFTLKIPSNHKASPACE
jgi:MFS family permease